MGRGPHKLACVSILRQQRDIHFWLALLHYRSCSSGPELCIVRLMDARPVTGNNAFHLGKKIGTKTSKMVQSRVRGNRISTSAATI